MNKGNLLERVIYWFGEYEFSLDIKRWHLLTVEASEKVIEKLAEYIKPEKWYAHFWNGEDVIAVFPKKVFRFKFSDKSTWKETIEYGKSIGIPEKQLDFLINE